MRNESYHSVQFSDASLGVLDFAHGDESESSRSFRLSFNRPSQQQRSEEWKEETHALIVNNDDFLDGAHLGELVLDVTFTRTNGETEYTEHIGGIRILKQAINFVVSTLRRAGLTGGACAVRSVRGW